MHRLLVAMLVGLVAQVANAESLAGRLDSVITRDGLVNTGPSLVFVPRLVREAVRSADYPVTSTSPDFAYRFDLESGVAIREPLALGSIFLERADTVGRRHLQLGLSVLYSDAEKLDGRAVTGVITRSQVLLPSLGADDLATETLIFDDFALQTTALTPFATLGITDELDVNVVVPLLMTRLSVDGRRTIAAEGTGVIDVEDIDIDEQKFGVGDVLLRSKYRFRGIGPIGMASGLTIRLPTGDPDDFQGLGDLTVMPTFLLSGNVGAHDLHLNIGFDINSDNLARSRARYGAGVAFRLHDRCSVLFDVIGSSGIEDETIDAGGFRTLVIGDRGIRFKTVRIPFVLERTDIVDGAIGLKIKLTESAVAFASVLVPFTADGLRANIVPVGGVSLTF
jgi:hypothetical protein